MTARNIPRPPVAEPAPPPEVRSRTGYYRTEHVTRIRLIQDMQGQGFNLKSIERLLHLGSAGGAEQTLEIERLLLQPFGTEQPEAVAQEELGETFGDPLDRKLVAKAERIGALRPIGEGIWEVPSPTLLRASRELVALGIPLEHALAVGESITKHTTAIAREFVRLFVKDVLDPIREGSEPSDKALATAAEALERLRPLASEAVLASFGQVMTAAVERQMAKELG
ncbi:MAG: MerR family transcriptional regulator [Solirubrobacterales bacterium]|nr:MerR family transcriptional regulator [Solirubrobacterales bacterium]